MNPVYNYCPIGRKNQKKSYKTDQNQVHYFLLFPFFYFGLNQKAGIKKI